jgi:monoterpene epsilon-lactone hydrolase
VPSSDNRSLSLAGRILAAGTSLTLHPLLRRGNAAPSTRRVLETLGRLIGQTPRDVEIHHIEVAGVPVDEVIPRPATAPRASIMYLHGGAYVSGSARSYRRLVSHLAATTGYRVLAVDYRLAPEHPYPAALDDSISVYTALLAGEPAEKIVLAGDSAGGGLALATAISVRDRGVPLPGALVCIAPWTDLTCTGDSIRTRARRERMMTPAGLAIDARKYAGAVSLRNPLVSPLFADLSGLPPLLIQVGDDEVLLDDSTRLAAAAEQAGVRVDLQIWLRLWHVWHLYAGLVPEGGAAMRAIASFIDQHIE